MLHGSVFEPVYNTLQEVFPLATTYGYRYHVQLHKNVCKTNPSSPADKYSYISVCWTINKQFNT